MRRAIAALALLLAVAGCAEATAEVNTAVPAQADPQLVRAAERVLATAPTPEPGWRVGVIVAEANTKETGLFGKYDEWSIGVLAAGGMVFLSGDYCDGDRARGPADEAQPNADKVLAVLLDPGDLIAWSAKGNGLCASEVKQGDPEWWVSEVFASGGRLFTVRSARDMRPIARVERLDGDDDEPAAILDGAAVAEHIALHHPANVLRATAADRKLLAEYVEVVAYYLAYPNSSSGEVTGLDTAVESMAARYGIAPEDATGNG